MIPADNIAERGRLFRHLRDLDHDDQILFIMACLGTDGMRKVNDLADRLVAGSAQDVADEAQRVADALTASSAQVRRRWLISYRHASRDVWRDESRGRLPESEEESIEISDRHPVRWLLDAVLRNQEPVSPDLHVDRRTRVLCILSAIEIPADVADDDVAELENYL